MKCELLKNAQLTPEVFVSHRNAPLSETGRLRLARCVVEDGWSLRRAAERFQVAVTTAQRWASRYRELGPAGMADRSSRPSNDQNLWMSLGGAREKWAHLPEDDLKVQ
ncbi:hypothetical protein JHV675_24240 [Mycobacterium avium subsp. hominissuis]